MLVERLRWIRRGGAKIFRDSKRLQKPIGAVDFARTMFL
jgi:hypothetical protein